MASKRNRHRAIKTRDEKSWKLAVERTYVLMKDTTNYSPEDMAANAYLLALQDAQETLATRREEMTETERHGSAGLKATDYNDEAEKNGWDLSEKTEQPASENLGPWTCFHCGETFTDQTTARDHFGFDPSQDPACRIKIGAERSLVNALRVAEMTIADLMSSINNESTEMSKAMALQALRHTTQIRAAEEAGYERGLAAGMALRNPQPDASKPTPTFRYQHKEAFCLMHYGCTDCGFHEVMWNSRDGVTPFCIKCPSCGKLTEQHVNWGADALTPEHKLEPGQRFFRDGTPDEALAIIEKRIASASAQGYQMTAETKERLRLDAVNSEGEWRKGWPMIDQAPKGTPQ